MVDDDVMNYIDKDLHNRLQDKSLPKSHLDVALILLKETQGFSNLTEIAYKQSEEEGKGILTSVLTAILIVNSKNIDQAIERLDKVYENTRKNMIKLDKEVNTK